MHKIRVFSWIFILIIVICLLVNSSDSSMNIAKHKSATQSTRYNNQWTEDKAVDGVILSQNVLCNCCAVTGVRQQTAWWQVDLDTLSAIRRIKIYYRKTTANRLAGYFLYVSNSSRGTDVLCYRDPISTVAPNTTQDLQCNYTARYVYIYNERLDNVTYPASYGRDAFLELCEVEVYGCPFGHFGDDCGTMCPSNCKTEGYICDPDNGNCASGCKDGFVGLQCNECIDGLYGQDCDRTCPENCFNDTCERENGDCLFGCQRNFSGSKCNVCSTGRYGIKCDKICSSGCLGLVCEQNDGTCADGCKIGFNGTKCDECSNGLYGNTCNKNCSVGCVKTVCEQTSGKCNFGCIERFDGDACEECIYGRYGIDCQYNCSSNCKDEQCQRLTGECIHGCTAGWEGVSCNVSISPTMQSSGPPIQASTIGVAVIGIVVALIVIVAALIFMKRRSIGLFKNSRNNSNENILDSPEDIPTVKENILNNQKLEGEKPKKNVSSPVVKYDRNDIYLNTAEIYYNMNIPGTPVREIKQYVAQKTKQDFEKEYKKLSDGVKFPHTHASKPENKLKNRFQKPYCYDHSRVILPLLPGQPDSDFINANYIDRVDDQKCYIATQGPRANTVTDFWRMVWEVNSSLIVMLTNLVEMGKVKCEQYWPGVGQKLDAGQFAISLEDVQEFASFSLRNLLLINTNDDTSRQILQYHFTTWPDHGTPDHTEIILFQRRIAGKFKDATGPMIVHCSAGIGRTGTFIALDALLNYGNRTGRIVVSEYVKTMRKDRANMVQTVEQYIFLNEIMIEAFDFEDTTLTRKDINDLFNADASDTERLQRIEKEFGDLQSKKKSYSDNDYKTALTKANKNKNKDNCPLALDKYRPFINARMPMETNYINAVILPAFNRKDGYIVSHTPLSNTDVDLWSVIVDHQCKTLVVFDVDESEKSSRWLPSVDNEIELDNFTIKNEVDKEIEIENIKNFTVSVSEKGKALDLKVKTSILSSWTNKELLKSKQQFILLAEFVDLLRSTVPGPVTVLCPDGVTECGLFCVVLDVIGNFRSNGEADVYQTVRRIQCRRPECISSIEQYQFCYEVLKEYSNSESVYANN